MDARGTARINRAKTEVDHLRREIREWVDFRTQRDVRRQYRTQLETLDAVLNTGLDGVMAQVDGLTSAGGVGFVYERCAETERAGLWVRRVWEYFREKFDQRDDPELGPLLRAADEVVWSCWAEPVERAGMALTGSAASSPVPLPYVDTLYAPQAFLRGRPPPALQLPPGVPSELRREMNDFLRRLPVPVVALPAGSVRAPWWLALLPHEVAHHLQTELVPDLGLVTEFAAAVAAAAAELGATEASAWRSRGEELFADAMGVFAVGPAALWVSAEALLTSDAAMERSTVRYPSPAQRLALLDALCREAGAPPEPGLVPEAEPPAADGAGFRANRLASAIAAWSSRGLEPLPVLAGWNPQRFDNDVRYWTEVLNGQRVETPQEERHAARTLAGATTLACAAALRSADAHERVAAIRERALPLIAESREPGTRAAEAGPPRASAGLGRDFAALLRRPTREPVNAHG